MCSSLSSPGTIVSPESYFWLQVDLGLLLCPQLPTRSLWNLFFLFLSRATSVKWGGITRACMHTYVCICINDIHVKEICKRWDQK